jgi:hypothetical protein
MMEPAARMGREGVWPRWAGGSCVPSSSTTLGLRGSGPRHQGIWPRCENSAARGAMIILKPALFASDFTDRSATLHAE